MIDWDIVKSIDPLFKYHKPAACEISSTLSVKFSAEGKKLHNYTIYGSSAVVNGETKGVGDKTANLFDISSIIKSDNYVRNDNGEETYSQASGYLLNKISVSPSTVYTISGFSSSNNGTGVYRIYMYDSNMQWIRRTEQFTASANNSYTFTADANAYYISIQYTIDEFSPETIQLIQGSSAPAVYEHYGYKIPVTISGKNLFNASGTYNVNASIGVNDGVFPFSTGGNRYTVFFSVKPDTSYTFSCSAPGDRLCIVEYNSVIDPQNYSLQNTLSPDRTILLSSNGAQSYTFSTSSNAKSAAIYYSNETSPADIQIEEDIQSTSYEQYIEPVTVNIYLDSPLMQSQYISYLSKKRFPDETSVVLPPVHTLSGTNVLSVGTTVQPSGIVIKGKLREL